MAGLPTTAGSLAFATLFRRRCVPGEEAARRGGGDPREDEPAGARVGIRHGRARWAARRRTRTTSAQSRRIEWRHRRGGRRELRGRRAGHRHLRIDPDSRVAQRAGRPAQHDGPRQPRRRLPACRTRRTSRGRWRGRSPTWRCCSTRRPASIPRIPSPGSARGASPKSYRDA